MCSDGASSGQLGGCVLMVPKMGSAEVAGKGKHAIVDETILNEAGSKLHVFCEGEGGRVGYGR